MDVYHSTVGLGPTGLDRLLPDRPAVVVSLGPLQYGAADLLERLQAAEEGTEDAGVQCAHIYVYIHMCASIYIHTYVCIRMYTCTYRCIHMAYMLTYICIH